MKHIEMYHEMGLSIATVCLGKFLILSPCSRDEVQRQRQCTEAINQSTHLNQAPTVASNRFAQWPSAIRERERETHTHTHIYIYPDTPCLQYLLTLKCTLEKPTFECRLEERTLGLSETIGRVYRKPPVYRKG